MHAAGKLILGVVLLVAPLRATPEFVGVLITPGREQFALADPNGNQPTCWVERGQQVEDYTVAEYFPATETLVLKHAAGEIRLSLRKDKIATPTPNADEMRRIATQMVTGNEHWSEPVHYQGPHLFKNSWVVVAHHGGASGIETRVVVFSAGGVMRDYLAQPALTP